MAGFLFFSKGRNLAWFLLVNLAIFENPKIFRALRARVFIVFNIFPKIGPGFYFFQFSAEEKIPGFLRGGGFNSNAPVSNGSARKQSMT